MRLTIQIEPASPLSMRQLILDLLPETPPRLDNFVVGGNGETLTGLAAWLAPGNSESSLFLWGETGAGKTHLLRACAADEVAIEFESEFKFKFAEQDSTANYYDAASDPDLAGTDRHTQNDHYPRLLAVDNVEALSELGQIALFNQFNRLRAAGNRLLTAGSHAPRHLALREDLRTRLGSGLVYRLQALSDAEKIDTLTTQAEARGLRLPADAFNYLLAHAPRDMRSLSALLAALDRYSLEHKRPITMPLLREVLLNTPLIQPN